MANWYVGTSSAGSANGTSWANRVGSLTAAEALSLAAGDTVYVGPGAYRETLTLTKSGTSGNPISYVGDITGEHTDGVGGAVRLTGSNDDLATARTNLIDFNTRSHRTFRGFAFDLCSGDGITGTSGASLVIEDCLFQSIGGHCVIWTTGAGARIRRSVFFVVPAKSGVEINSTQASIDATIENCVFLGGGASAENGVRVWGASVVTIRNCNFLFLDRGVRQVTSVVDGVIVNNCLFMSCDFALQGGTSGGPGVGDVIENYNSFHKNSANYATVSAGANSGDFPPLFNPLPLLAGFRLTGPVLFDLSEWSALRRKVGTGFPSDDLFGRPRPATSGKLSWGPIQWTDSQRETTTVDAGGVSLKLADAGEEQFTVPVDATSTTITVKVYRETDYAGTLPQMIVKQPGQADITVTDTGSAGAWNTLSSGAFTPAANPGFVTVVIRSNNTATSGNYSVYVDTGGVA